jgi:hypothetical protein
MPPDAVVVDGVDVTIGPTLALDGVDLRVPPRLDGRGGGPQRRRGDHARRRLDHADPMTVAPSGQERRR